MSNSMNTKSCAKLIEVTISKCGAPEIHNSNQGFQYSSTQYIDVLKNHEIEISIYGKGSAMDNIYIEHLSK